MENKEATYETFKDMFMSVIDKHAPLKTRLIRGNHAPFVDKELSKAIMHRSKLLNTFHKKTVKLLRNKTNACPLEGKTHTQFTKLCERE